MAYPTSDPFTKLPAELRLHIIMSTTCMTTISRLIRASPPMLQQYLANKRYIQRNVIDYDEVMMQDAMAIILIPRLCRTSKKVPDEKAVTRARTVLQDWSIGQLPHPIMSDNNTSQLGVLHNKILILAEDYISKATASFPPREYCCLPQVQPPSSANGHLMFKGVKVAPRFNFADLSASEKKRVLKAFLRHELMCRVSTLFPDAVDWPMRTSESGIRCEVCPSMPDAVYLPMRSISQAEIEGINCVGDYYCSLYGAIFAQCSDAQLPSSPDGTSPDETSLETELEFPDTFLFDGDTYAHRLNLFGEDPRYEKFPQFTFWFSRLGIDRLTEFLCYDMSKEDGREALKLQIRSTWFGGDQRQELRWETPDWTIFKPLKRSDHSGYDSAMYEKLNGSLQPILRRDIARQRAWPFFDDTRLNPQESYERPNFPSDSFLEKELFRETDRDA